MIKKYSLKFWIIFWTYSSLFLFAWFLFWNCKNQGVGTTVSQLIEYFPIESVQKKQFQTLVELGDYFYSSKETVLLILFQNNLEIRPGGGFLGAFAIVKIKNGSIISMETHDLSNFDKQIPNNIAPPYPMKEIGYVDFWKMRDSNFSPDFATNARKVEEFYALGGGKEKVDGVVGITANMLTSILKITGPIQVEDYPGTYSSENAVIALEYQVEKAFETQGIPRGERKSVMNELAKEIENRVFSFSIPQKYQLVNIIIADLTKKDIQLYFQNPDLQTKASAALWTGSVDQSWSKDFLMTVDANLGSFKSDYYVKRSIDYFVDLSKKPAEAQLKITYQHTAKQKDWMTRDYVDYLRVYVPENSQLIEQKNIKYINYNEEFGKGYFDGAVVVPINSTVEVEIHYDLPDSIKNEYGLKIQKQAGLNDIPVTLHLRKADGSEAQFSKTMNSDIIFK